MGVPLSSRLLLSPAYLTGHPPPFDPQWKKAREAAPLAAAKRRGRQGGRPPTIDVEMMEQIKIALDGGASKSAVCRSFKVPRSTLIGSLGRVGWSAPAKP